MTDPLPNSPYLDMPKRTEAQAAAERRVNALRKPVTARQMDVVWRFPRTDCRLILDVDFDEYGVPHINDVLDADRKSFPVDEVWTKDAKGKFGPLADVLIEYLTNTPADELERV
jgi:hypothetical protein